MVGRNKFFMPGTGVPMPLGGGLEAVRGFYSSVRTAHQALMVNVNGMCIDIICEKEQFSDLSPQFVQLHFTDPAI